MQIASQVASHSGNAVLYVDSGNSFDERRCLSMLGEASSSQSQRRASMNRISTCVCFDGFQLLDALYSAKRRLSETTVCQEFYSIPPSLTELLSPINKRNFGLMFLLSDR